MFPTPAETVNDILEELKKFSVMDPSNARSMLPSFYTSPEFLELEKDRIFRKDWVCLGHVSEIQNTGDFFTTELVDEQLIVSRGENGKVHVLSNVCRHRGNLVVQGKGNRRSFVCGYHAWTYDLDGTLKTAPLMNKVKNFDPSTCSLPQFNTEVWSNFIFVNLDGNAPPLAPQLPELQTILNNYHNEQRNLLFEEEVIWKTNWKNLSENFMEGYHLFSTHPKTLQPMTPTQLCKKVPGEKTWTAYRSYYDPNFPSRGPFHKDMTEDEQRNTVLFNLFPSFVAAVSANYTLYLCLRPKGAGNVAVRWGVTSFKDTLSDPEVINYLNLCKEFFEEDKEKLETLQISQNTRYFRGGPLAPGDLEGTIWDFFLYMESKLNE
ncbi:MAG: aromatic ring-hydroxylating dioxygenase subunit alpha [Proteobacteria bacterium]|jgi:choline monooxygenase|nr:aromatic ring-hydroxylating dioxygenase subunit alpha [Pseudomonadota bacterium]